MTKCLSKILKQLGSTAVCDTKEKYIEILYLSSNYIINRFLNEETPSTERMAEVYHSYACP
jgi:hypothetical protein